MYCYVWEFTVRSESLGEFEWSYGPEGEWVQLFRRDPQYVRSLLLKDREEPARFVSIDFWTSRGACQAFRERFRSEYEALDARFEALTLQERHVGDFDIRG
ncbi:MAG: hypothetical protein ACRD21_11320 [Vicinamibacteria bacterium]